MTSLAGPGVDRSDVRVAHVSSAHQYSDNRVHLREAASLREAGYDVHLVAVDSTVDVPDTGVTLHLLQPRTRLNRLVLGSAAAVRTAIRTGADIYHLHDPELIWAIPLLRIMGKKVIYDAHEDLPSQLLDKHYLSPRARSVTARFSTLALRTTRLASSVVSATERIAETFPNAGPVIHNYPRLLAETASRVPIGQRPYDVVYVGAMSEERGTLNLIRALSDPRLRDIRIAIAGTPTPIDLLDEVKDEPAWQNIDLHEQISPMEARALVRSAKVGVVTFVPNQAQSDALPTKMFEYFAEGLPVVMSNFPLWADIVARHRCGITVDPLDPTSIATGISTYLNDPQLLDEHAQNAARASVESLNWDSEGKALIALYDSLRPASR